MDNRPSPKIRIAQLNAQNSKTVLDEIRQTSFEGKYDILLLQEPYSFRNAIASLGISTRVITDNKNFTNIGPAGIVKAAIAIRNPTYTVLKIEQYCNTHCICAEIISNSYKFYIISTYLQCSDKIEPYLNHLDTILRKLRGQNIFIGMDANAKSAT